MGTATAKSMVLNIVFVHIIGMMGTLVFWGANPQGADRRLTGNYEEDTWQRKIKRDTASPSVHRILAGDESGAHASGASAQRAARSAATPTRRLPSSAG